MDRPKLEVADVLRRYGDAYRENNNASLSTAQRRVMSAIELCRTAALGGHVEECDQCEHQRIFYNSCLMESNLYWGVRSAWCQLLSD
jgi:Transposase zinc-binding domain